MLHRNKSFFCGYFIPIYISLKIVKNNGFVMGFVMLITKQFFVTIVKAKWHLKKT